MGRLLAALGLVSTLVLTAGCAADPPAAGVLSIAVAYVEPAPDQPRSIGGYAEFGSITNAAGELVWSDEILGMPNVNEVRQPTELIELPAGTYGLVVTIRSASDAIVVDQDGNVHRDIGPVTATCNADLEVPADGALDVVLSVVGGESCSIGVAL